jgi:hypothetical protein
VWTDSVAGAEREGGLLTCGNAVTGGGTNSRALGGVVATRPSEVVGVGL